MTTIIATPDALYSDSLITGNPVAFKSEKLYRVGRSIIGAAGSTMLINGWLDAYRRRRKYKIPLGLSEEDLDLNVLIVNKKGIWHMDETLAVDRVKEPFMTIGSGAQAAFAVLRYQQRHSIPYDYKLAIEIASEIDEATRLPLQVIYLDPKRGNDVPTSL